MTESDEATEPQQHRHKAFDDILTIAKAGEYPFLVGPTGSGKSTIGEQIADKLNLPFSYAGAVQSPFELRGFKDAHGNYQKTPFVIAYEEGGVFMQDEMDASDSRALVALNNAIANKLLDTPDGMVKMHPDFHLIASANTAGTGATRKYVGRNKLDAATLDRYIQIEVDYDHELERVIAQAIGGEEALPMLAMIHQARAASRDLAIDDYHEISTRSLVKAVHLVGAGMDKERAFFMATLDKLSKEDAEKILHRIDQDTAELDILKILNSADEFTAQIASISERLGSFSEAEAKITQAVQQGDQMVAQAFEAAGSVGSEIKSAEATLERLKAACVMLSSLDADVAQKIIHEAQRALDKIKNNGSPPSTDPFADFRYER